MTLCAIADNGSAICWGDYFPVRQIGHCPTCKKRRRFAGRDGGLYYGITWTCCGCGDRWTGSERHERPFRPRWRQENIAAAKETWRIAPPKAEHKKWLDALSAEWRAGRPGDLEDDEDLQDDGPAMVTVQLPDHDVEV